MFTVYISLGYSKKDQVDIEVQIEDCPRDGIEAVDFRRKHGLPESPGNKITLPAWKGQDEEFIRCFREYADEEADIQFRFKANQEVFSVNAVGVVYSKTQYASNSYAPVVPAEVVKAYLTDQCQMTARMLLREIWAYSARSKRAAEDEVEWIKAKEQALEEQMKFARELLKDEIGKLQQQIADVLKENECLTKALKPFAKLSEDNDDQDAGNDGLIQVRVNKDALHEAWKLV